MTKHLIINWKVFWILLIASILGILAAMPFVLTTQEDVLSQVPLPIPLFILLAVVQGGVLFFVVILVGLVVSKKIGFGAPILERLAQKKEVKTHVKSIVGLSIGLGVLAGVLIIIGDYLLAFFTGIPPILTASTGAIWQGFFASLYGGINEELLMRLFFMSLLIWLFSKIKKTDEGKPTQMSIWVAIFLAAILFGLGHLPFTAAIMEITPAVIARAILLNGIGGVIFGWLYWRKGLESAMISHFSADIVLYVIFPLISR